MTLCFTVPSPTDSVLLHRPFAYPVSFAFPAIAHTGFLSKPRWWRLLAWLHDDFVESKGASGTRQSNTVQYAAQLVNLTHHFLVFMSSVEQKTSLSVDPHQLHESQFLTMPNCRPCTTEWEVKVRRSRRHPNMSYTLVLPIPIHRPTPSSSHVHHRTLGHHRRSANAPQMASLFCCHKNERLQRAPPGNTSNNS